MTPADRHRFLKCLALAEHGATEGERAAACAAAARIAAGAGLTLAEARAGARPGSGGGMLGADRPSPPPRSYAWARPRDPVEPITVEEMLRQKAETEAWRKRRTAAADRARARAYAAEEAYRAEQRAMQAERDRDGAAGRGG